MEIRIRTIPHSTHRYDTHGDWIPGASGQPDEIRVSACGHSDHEFLLALHELVEFWLCRRRGITVEVVDAFDMAFSGEGEPGDDPAAPYWREHQEASGLEGLMAALLGVDWDAYNSCLAALGSGGSAPNAEKSSRASGQ